MTPEESLELANTIFTAQPAEIEAAKKRENLRPMTIGQVVGRTVYTGRNDRCPCGSGLKYKKCHRVFQTG